MASRNFSGIILLFLTIAAIITVAYSSKECVITLFVKTGDESKAGTDSKINLTMTNSMGKSLRLSNLEDWGLMGKDYDYFERGNLDVFAFRKKCIALPICKLKLGTDAKGYSPGWYVEYIELTVNQPGEECSQSFFPVNQWVGIDESSSVITVTLDSCKNYVS